MSITVLGFYYKWHMLFIREMRDGKYRYDRNFSSGRESMPRPKKCRKVCSLPGNREFLPANCGRDGTVIIMTVDEYEALRLIDKEGFSQEGCGKYMRIARTTVQQIYNSARKKIACALVDGRPLKIEGGDYRLCDGEEAFCSCGGCEKHRCGKVENACRETEMEKIEQQKEPAGK